jgi:hypothetical protein
MNVLIGCEESQKVCQAFRKAGHKAFSCDLLPTRGDVRYHIQKDILGALCDLDWDVVILHPPCTCLSVSGNGTYGTGKAKNYMRLNASGWTSVLWEHAKDFARVGVCLENPRGVLWRAIGKCTQEIQPWQFGHGETKATQLWLDRLPPLKPTNIVEGREQRIWKMGPSETRSRDRSETYQGIADAMAAQWGSL